MREEKSSLQRNRQKAASGPAALCGYDDPIAEAVVKYSALQKREMKYRESQHTNHVRGEVQGILKHKKP